MLIRKKTGTYEIIYTVTDSAGNRTELVRTVHVVTVDSIKVANPVQTVKVGDEYPLTVQVVYSDGYHKDITDQIDASMDKGLVRIDSNGNLEGIQSSVYPDTITFTYKQATTKMTVLVVDQISHSDEGVPVQPNDLMLIKDTRSFIKMPEDLPDGTTVVSRHIEMNPDTLQAAGDILDIHMHYPQEFQDYTGEFEFMLNRNDDTDPEKTAVFYYNPDREEWEHIGGEIKEDWMVVEVPHFSTYGVFTDTEGPDIMD